MKGKNTVIEIFSFKSTIIWKKRFQKGFAKKQEQENVPVVRFPSS